MRKIWLDTDPGVDDTVAIAMLFESKNQAELVGVSTVFGNVEAEGTTRNAKILLEAAGMRHLPVARGASAPVNVPLETGAFVHGDNGLGNMDLPEPSMPESSLRAPQAIIDIILAHPHEITLLPIGPLTNIAMAYLLEPKIATLVKEVVIMGGAVLCPGNVTPVAEANFYHDPHAAQIVVRAGWPIVLAGLDVVEYGMVPQALLDKICEAEKPLTPYITGSLPFFQDFLETTGIYGKAYFPDTLAIGYLLAPEIFTVEEMPLYVEAEGTCRGQSVPVQRGKWYEDIDDTRKFSADDNIAPVKVLLKADTEKFLALLETLLT
jgi:inosine-uridine nucleoside N-ribohydrolase